MDQQCPPCPQCFTPTEPFEVEGEDLFRCPAAGCGRRTYGTGDPDDDDNLPPYEEDGILYRGNGEIDIEATGEWAAQSGPDEDDEGDEARLGTEEPEIESLTGYPRGYAARLLNADDTVSSRAWFGQL